MVAGRNVLGLVSSTLGIFFNICCSSVLIHFIVSTMYKYYNVLNSLHGDYVRSGGQVLHPAYDGFC